MSVYDLHFNKDDSTIRNILIGLIATLHDNIHWYNQTGSKITEKRKINVPFYFSTTGTERYLQDNFLNNIDFDPDNLKAEAFYNKIPRGVVDLTGINVEAQAIVNKYVRMFHQVQEEDGTLNTYNTECFWVPIILAIDCKVYTDSILDQLKCTEQVIRTFFKNKSYQVDVAYTRIPCLILFPDDYTNERTLEFSFTDKREFTTSFSLQVKTYIPVFKPETSIFAGTTMTGFQTNVAIPPSGINPNNGSAGPSNQQQNSDLTPGNPSGVQPPTNILPGSAVNQTTSPSDTYSGYSGTPPPPTTGGDALYSNANPVLPTEMPADNPDQTNSPIGGTSGFAPDGSGTSGTSGSSGTSGPSVINPPNTPSWPINPATIYPPEGGTANPDPTDRF